MKYLIVGLGNIGAEYKGTRHNIGFDIADKLVDELKGEFTVERLASIAYLKHKGRQLVVAKPTTYMNLSGKAVKYWMDKEKIAIENILVLVDDIALPLGTLRMKTKGGDAGHNGLIDIIGKLGTSAFTRLRFGIGNDFPRGYQSDYVLGKWKSSEIDDVINRIDIAVEMVLSYVAIGPALTMTRYNK